MKFHETAEFRLSFLRQEEHALNTFVEHFVKVLMGLAKAKGLNHQEAEDSVQECFGVFFRKLPELRAEVKLSTFLLGIFINSVREVRRKRGRHETHADLAGVEGLLDQQYDQKGHWRFDVAPLPLDALLEQEFQGKFQLCLESLPDRSREALALSLSGGTDPQEACHILGISYANFRQLLTRTRQALRLCLENYLREKNA